MKNLVFCFYNRLVNTKLLDSKRFYKIIVGPLSGTYIFASVRHGIKKILGIYEPEVLAAISKQVSKGSICVDIGAHVGYITLYLRKLTGATGAFIHLNRFLIVSAHSKKL